MTKQKAPPTSTYQTLDKISKLIQEYADCQQEMDSFKTAALVYQTVLNDLRDILSEGKKLNGDKEGKDVNTQI